MKFIDPQGRTFQPALIAEVPIGNLLWVDPLNGIDALATRGRMTLPFKTLTAAKAAAVSGDTIMVLPGTYNEKNLLKDGVNWHFMNGAVVSYDGAVAGGIFDTSSNGADGPVISEITGSGVFEMTNPSSSSLLYVNESASRLSIQSKSLSSVAWCFLISAIADAVVEIEAAGEITGTVAGVLYAVGGGADVVCKIRAGRIYCPSASCVYAEAGTMEIVADEIISDAAVAIDLLGGIFSARAKRIAGTFGLSVQLGAIAEVEANEVVGIDGWGGNGVAMYDDGSEVTIKNCRIVSVDTAPLLVDNGASPSDPPACRLWNCFLKGPGGSYSIDGGGDTPHVGLYGLCSGNHDLDPTVVPVKSLAQFVEDAPLA